MQNFHKVSGEKFWISSAQKPGEERERENKGKQAKIFFQFY
jgi:hypothetical protein